MHPCHPRPLALAIALLFAGALPASAEDNEKQLGEMTVKSSKAPLPRDLPATTEGVTASQINETVNAETTAATLKYLPSIVVRERYIGDRNGIVSTRTTGTLSSAQSVVLADGLLLSNFLGNRYDFPPRWGMVAPSSIDRVDVVYGPFSALYPGNSMGGVVVLSTRMPDKFEAHASLQGSQQRFKLYGTSESYNNTHASAALGDRIGDWSFWISGDHLDSHGQPMSFGTAKLAPGAGGTAVTGAYVDRDPTGATRVIAGGYGIDHAIQNNGTVKVAYDFSPTVRATYTLGIWQNDSDTTVDSYLRNASGQAYYNTASGQYVRINNQRYTVAGLNPGHAESEHWMHGLSVKSNSRGEWDFEATASLYDYQRDIARTASNTGLDSGSNQATRPAGSLQKMDGTGWANLDLRGEWRPGGLDRADHRVSFGYHFDRYALDSHTYATSDWLNGSAGAQTAASQGRTATQAVYAQDAWRFATDWKAVLGLRAESWRAYGGMNANSTSTPRTATYAARQESAFSPKLALSYQASADWLLRGSLGKATRFPTVSELFQAVTSGSNKLVNDPNLKPESVWSGELTAERAVGSGLLRISLFQENKRDALYSQTDTTVSPNVTSIQNVDKIRTRGIETAWQFYDVGLAGLDLGGSVTYADSVILKDARFPAAEGKIQPRIPDWRAKLVATYHQGDALSYTLAARYSGKQHNQLDNLDINPATYGGTSKYFLVDARVVYRVNKQWSASAGVDNLNNYKAYVAHPWPQRTLFAGLKFDY